jgi:hypothetical protein
MKKIFYTAVITGFAGALLAGMSLGSGQKLPEVVTEKIPTTPPEHKMPLMIPRVASTPASVASRNQQFIFADETLLSPDATEKDEFAWCSKAGAVAVIEHDKKLTAEGE